MQSHEIKQRLDASAELSCLKTQTLLSLIVLSLYLLLALFETRSLQAGFAVLAIPLVVCCLPFLIFFAYRFISIYRKKEHYIFFRAKLSHPHRSTWTRAMYFTVLAEDLEGMKFPVNTHAIFETHGLGALLLEDYINKTVTIGYNEETGMVVVIG